MLRLPKISFITGALLCLVTGCSGIPTSDLSMQNQFELAPGTLVVLPEPAELGYSLTASQLITAQWQDQSSQLPVQLEVGSEKLVLAGFSSWGARILSLTYQNQSIETQVLPGLEGTLPEPEQVLFNLMLTLWPVESWAKSLAEVGWQIKETSTYRQLIDEQGKTVIEIHYGDISHLDGEILFTNTKLGYVISIKTLNYSR